MGWVAGVAAAAGAGLSVMQGAAAKQQANAQRKVYEQERKGALLAAKQDEVARRSRLADVLATQQAILGGRGVDLFGPQSFAIEAASRSEAEADIGAARLTYLNRAERLRQAGQMARAQGQSAFVGGLLGGGLRLLSAAGSLDTGDAGGLPSAAELDALEQQAAIQRRGGVVW